MPLTIADPNFLHRFAPSYPESIQETGIENITTVGTHSFVVPDGITKLLVECWGAQGERSMGGGGGYAKGVVDVTPGETLTLHIGSRTSPYNAADVRRGGSALSNRIIIGAGGGAAGDLGRTTIGGEVNQGGVGGLGGIHNANLGGTVGEGTGPGGGARSATQSAVGAGGAAGGSGDILAGGSGGNGSGSNGGSPGTGGLAGPGPGQRGGDGGRGGGGLFGGGGGGGGIGSLGIGATSSGGGGGGGGSSMVSGTQTEMSPGVNNGNGRVQLTWPAP